jgi:hypothetical protein
MRTTSCLVGLTLVALASTARAQEAAATTAQPAPALATAPAPAAPAAAPAPQSGGRLQIGLAFLPMAKGKVTATAGKTVTADGAFATGVGLSLGYEILPGLLLGIAPQAIYHGKVKEAVADSDTEYDLLARVAYAFTIPDVVSLYAEVLPGYSIIYPAVTDTSKGLVVAFGVGAAMDLTKHVFANLGVGYQKGFQNQTAVANYRTDYLRFVLGTGVKF